jgi:hypothetical protein
MMISHKLASIRINIRTRFGRDYVSGRLKPMMCAIACIGGALLVSGVAPERCRADGGSAGATAGFTSTEQIYLYQPNGQPPLNVTQTYLTYGYVFDASGNPLYIQIDGEQVHDLIGHTIGYVTQ